MQCIGLQCSALKCSAVECSAKECSAVQYSKVQYSTVQLSIVKYGTRQYSTIRCGTVWYVVVLVVLVVRVIRKEDTSKINLAVREEEKNVIKKEECALKNGGQRTHSKTNQNFDNLEFEAKIILNMKKRSGRVGKRAPKKNALKT